MYTIQKVYSKGEIDYYGFVTEQGTRIKQNRYVVLNSEGIDERGEHHNFKYAVQIKNELNQEKKISSKTTKKNFKL